MADTKLGTGLSALGQLKNEDGTVNESLLQSPKAEEESEEKGDQIVSETGGEAQLQSEQSVKGEEAAGGEISQGLISTLKKKVVVDEPVKEESLHQEEEKDNLLDVFSGSFDKMMSHEESRKKFFEDCGKSKMTPEAVISICIQDYDIVSSNSKRIEELEKRLKETDPKFASLIQKDKAELDLLIKEKARAEKLIAYAEANSYAREQIHKTNGLHKEAGDIISQLISVDPKKTNPEERGIYERSLIHVMESLTKIQDSEKRHVVGFADRESDKASMIRIGRQKYVPSFLLKEDRVLAGVWGKVYSYYRTIIRMRAEGLHPEFEHIRKYFFKGNADGSVESLDVNPSTKEVDYYSEDLFISEEEFADFLLNSDSQALSEDDPGKAVMLDIWGEKRMEDGMRPYNYGTMLLEAHYISPKEVRVVLQGLIKDDDEYFLRQNMDAAELIFSRGRNRSGEVQWYEGTLPEYVFVRAENGAEKIPHPFVREAILHAVKNQKKKIQEQEKIQAKEKRNEAFIAKLKDFDKLEGVTDGIPYRVFRRGVAGTLAYDRPDWSGNRVRGYLHSTGVNVAYKSVGDRDDRERMNLPFFSAPDKEMPLKSLLQDKRFLSFIRDNLLEERLEELYHRRLIDRFVTSFDGKSGLPKENFSFYETGLFNGKLVGYSFYYAVGRKGIKGIGPDNDFSRDNAGHILNMDGGRFYRFDDLPERAIHFLLRSFGTEGPHKIEKKEEYPVTKAEEEKSVTDEGTIFSGDPIEESVEGLGSSTDIQEPEEIAMGAGEVSQPEVSLVADAEGEKESVSGDSIVSITSTDDGISTGASIVSEKPKRKRTKGIGTKGLGRKPKKAIPESSSGE